MENWQTSKKNPHIATFTGQLNTIIWKTEMTLDIYLSTNNELDGKKKI